MYMYILGTDQLGCLCICKEVMRRIWVSWSQIIKFIKEVCQEVRFEQYLNADFFWIIMWFHLWTTYQVEEQLLEMSGEKLLQCLWANYFTFKFMGWILREILALRMDALIYTYVSVFLSYINSSHLPLKISWSFCKDPSQLNINLCRQRMLNNHYVSQLYLLH